MEHNEISSLYRKILGDVGVDLEGNLITPTDNELLFWDKRVYAFSRLSRGKSLQALRASLLLDIFEAVFTLEELLRSAKGVN